MPSVPPGRRSACCILGTLVSPTATFSGSTGQRAIEIPQAALKPLHEVGVYRWLTFGVAACWLCTGLIWLVDAQRLIQQLIRVCCASVLGYEQQDATIQCFKNSQEAPGTIKIPSANDRDVFSRQPYARGNTSALAYLIHSQVKRSLGLATQGQDLLSSQLRRHCRDCQLGSSEDSSSRRAHSRSSPEGTYSSLSSPECNCCKASASLPSA
jgi:hypothetical protein